MRLTTLFTFLALTALPLAARADASNDPQVARLLQAKAILKWNYTPAGKTDRYGHAEALVNAPADKVAVTMVEFGQYKNLHRKFATARVINKEGDKTDVYMRYPVQIGPMKIEFYEVMRFSPTRVVDGTYVLEGNAIKGDMKGGQTVISVKPVDATHSILAVDILLVPKIFCPQSLVDEELRDGAGDFVNGLKDRAQGHPGVVASL
jgi:hypothetical protein